MLQLLDPPPNARFGGAGFSGFISVLLLPGAVLPSPICHRGSLLSRASHAVPPRLCAKSHLPSISESPLCSWGCREHSPDEPERTSVVSGMSWSERDEIGG